MDDLVYGIAIHYPDGSTGMSFADAAPLVGTEVKAGWFVAATRSVFPRTFNELGVGIDFEVDVTADPTEHVHDRVVRIVGVPIREGEARDIVTTLVSDGTRSALALANRLTTCIDLGAIEMELDAHERSTLVAVLEEHPETLVELRGQLVGEHRD